MPGAGAGGAAVLRAALPLQHLHAEEVGAEAACPVFTCVCRWLARQDLDRERIILGVEAGPGTNTTLGDQFYACAVGDIGRYNQCKQEFFQNLDLKLERL